MTSKKNLYLELVVSGLPRSIEPALSSWLFRQGCWGTQERLDFFQPDLRYEPQIRQSKIITVSAYFDPELRENVEGPLLVWLRDRSPETKINWDLQHSQDWLKEWKKHFKKFTLAGLNIIPVWQTKKITAQQRKKSIIIEPGMAFGTGTHATTKFALEMLAKLGPRLSQLKVLDVGAGSGILSVAAERFGAKNILAMDIDPESWRECQKTFKLNKTRKCKVSESPIHKIPGQYNVVVANIIDGVLIDLKETLWKKTKVGGFIILSGILTVGARAFEKSFLEGKKGRVVARLRDQEWTSLLISK